ncbi:hypothetical protein ACIGHB_30285 [Streptomyces sp. NPDC085460]|uniref:hypothetical protein n=1 Tax=Streptomyces sp. NPDC085460 TaxID=3365723 RepID=UPI0037D88786
MFTTRDAAARATAPGACPVLRVTPHINNDSCGFGVVHASYSLAYSIPMLCRYPDELCVESSVGEEQLRRTCARCLTETGGKGGPQPGDLPVAWRDLTAPETLRAEVVPAAEFLKASEEAAQWPKLPRPEPYRWGELASRFYDWEEAHPAPKLRAEEELALAGVFRHVKQRQLAFAEQRVRILLKEAHEAGLGPTRLQALSGVSRRTIPGWLRADA